MLARFRPLVRGRGHRGAMSLPIAPGYTEQNDPIAQRNTLEHQAGGEQQKLDEDSSSLSNTACPRRAASASASTASA